MNDVTDAATLANLLRYDSTHGPWEHRVAVEGDSLSIDGHTLHVRNEPDPAHLPWRDLGVDLAIERPSTTSCPTPLHHQLPGADDRRAAPRRARSAAVNMIPTSTGAASAIGEVLPELAGRLASVAARALVENGSLTDLTAEVVATELTTALVNRAFADAADGRLKSARRH